MTLQSLSTFNLTSPVGLLDLYTCISLCHFKLNDLKIIKVALPLAKTKQTKIYEKTVRNLFVPSNTHNSFSDVIFSLLANIGLFSLSANIL